MAKRGRPRVLDDIKRREVCALISAGCGMEAAARYVGCSTRTIRREALRNVEFHQRLRKAEVGVELKPLEAIRTAAQSQWRAAAWLLERTNPERFARRDTNLVRPKDVTKLLEEFVETFVNEIAELPNCKAIADRLGAIVRRANRNLLALERPRRDPLHAQNILGPPPPEQVEIPAVEPEWYEGDDPYLPDEVRTE